MVRGLPPLMESWPAAAAGGEIGRTRFVEWGKGAVKAWTSFSWPFRSIAALKWSERAEGKFIPGCPIQQPVGRIGKGGHGTGPIFQLYHGLWCLCAPLASYVDEVFGGTPGAWTDEYGDLLDYVAPCLMKDCSAEFLEESVSVDVFAEYLCLLVAEHIGVEVDVTVVMSDVVSLVPLAAPPVRPMAHIMLFSNAVARHVGKVLANRACINYLVSLGAPHQDDASDDADVRAELVRIVQAGHKRPERDAPVESPMKRSRTAENIADTLESKTLQVEFAMKTSTRFANAPSTLLEAESLIRKLLDDDPRGGTDLEDALVSRRTLSRHALLLDSALDAHLAADIFKMRKCGTFWGVAFATDESPPGQVRFNGLRFQVTWLYIPIVSDTRTWENAQYNDRAPMSVQQVLLDICHCPNKTGAVVVAVLDRQLARVGLFRSDLVAGTGDGGGENEGRQGIHATLEAESDGYVRKRCHNHLSWNTACASLTAMGTVLDQVKAIGAYLSEGVTWTRLRALATTPLPDGLGLMAPFSREAADMFSKGCGTVLEGRPESVYNILVFLGPREGTLSRLVERDVAERGLGDTATKAAAALVSVEGRARRMIAREILRRCLYLHWRTSKYPRFLTTTTLERLVEKWARHLTSTSIDNHVLEALGLDATAVADMDNPPATWMELITRIVFGGGPAADAMWPSMSRFHLEASSRAVSHMKLAFSNITRTATLAGGLLSPDAEVAVKCANALLQRLDTTPPRNRTGFERALFSHPAWPQFEDFAAQPDPKKTLWRNHGKWADAFRFLAPRFLGSPDHVLDCEREHARWQWLLQGRRKVKLKMMNALARLRNYLESHGAFPPAAELSEHLEAEILVRRNALRALAEEDRIAPGYREDALYLDRFNLGPADLVLMEQAGDGRPRTAVYSWSTAWSNYVRKSFFPNRFHSVPGVSTEAVAEEAEEEEEEEGARWMMWRSRSGRRRTRMEDGGGGGRGGSRGGRRGGIGGGGGGGGGGIG